MRYCVFYDDTTPKVIEKMAEKEIIATLEAKQLRQNQEEMTRLRLSEAMAGNGDKRAARAQVNRLLREVDKCIALVSAKI